MPDLPPTTEKGRIADGDGVAYFVEGIGPPLQQIAHDYRTGIPKSQGTHDVVALIDHIDQLAAERSLLREALLKIALEPMRLHPIAGYMFDIDVRKIANEALNKAGAP